ncbi:amino acid ABC transporter permease [Ancylobacter terrae]|uniref:amino acid ABC transporter permease n=1 Tax=Ancylobacter sp. sgz301288 TaxID=3342077 RepID=UPI00385B4E85
MTYTFNFGQVWPFLPYLLGGAWVTVQLAVCAFVGGAVLGLAIAIGIQGGPAWVRDPLRFYRNFFTNTPQLVKILLIFFGLGEIGWFVSPFWAAVLGLMLAEAAYLAGIFRAGLTSVQQSELDAAETLGLRRVHILRHVVLPHVVHTVFPPLANQFIVSILYTSLASIIGVEELTGRAMNINSQTFRSFEIFTIIGAIYILLTVLSTCALYLFGRYSLGIRARVF